MTYLARALSSLRFIFVVAIISTALVSEAAYAGTPDEAEAQKFVTKLVDEAVNNVVDAKLSQSVKEERFRQMFVEAADIPGIAAFVVGREWRKTPAEQRTHFIKLFEDVSVLTWISHLDEYKGLKINITGAYTDRSDVFVESGINLAGENTTIPIVWRVQKRKSGELKLIDIVIEANSMLINTRKQYASVMKREGGLEGLIASLETMRTNLRTAKTE